MDLKAIKFGFVGVGEGGSRISQSFSLKNYAACVVNTGKSDSDCLDMKNTAKLVLDSGIEGAGKDLKVGEEIFSENQDLIREFLNSNMVGKINFLINTIGGGGGSGTGWIRPGIEICKELEIPTGVIYTLPLNSEDKTTKSNCIRGLKIFYELMKSKDISPIILIGSEKVLNKIPAKNIDYAFESINEIMSRGTVFKGVYRDESVKDKLVVFAVFSGLGLPEQRIEELKADTLQKLETGENEFDFGTFDDEEREDDWFFKLLNKKRIKKF